MVWVTWNPGRTLNGPIVAPGVVFENRRLP